MPSRRDQLFETITTEGALLPSDFLQRLAQRDQEVPGVTPEAYHLGSGERINEAISRSWNRLLAVWKSYAVSVEQAPASDLGTTLTRERWMLPMFHELGYGRLPTDKPFEFEGRRYSISHLWQNTPIHLVSFRADLDARSENITGARTTTPHSMVQEFLNRSPGHLWGLVSNGYRLRLLRDNASLTRQAYVEFDLQSMMQGEVYADFALLWLLLHQSRVEGERPELCWLEKWTQEARQRGARALDQLRDGVEEAITALGSGFLAHPANAALRDKLNAGTLSKQDYLRQLLRVVYRFLFLFVAEDRELLFAEKVLVKTREQYLRHYSMGRLRRIALRLGGTQHHDLWHVVRLVFGWLGSETGCSPLGLPALGSFLWSEKATPDLSECQLSNRDLLQTIRALAYAEQNRVRRPIDYKNIGTEELGSVYESLLEQHPDVHVPTAKFTLGTHAGHERKTTGSYYTPPSLVQCLLDSALEPVLAEACKKHKPEQAILELKVCDPACGSGHFLISAAHRIAKRLAAVRTGEGEPPPSALRHALRDVIGHCIYGVDINPMAVELCKFALWLEAMEPGKPLSFLDHHIQCGNSLIGATPALMQQGIPDKAFEPIEGDDKKYCAQFKKANKDEATQMQLFAQDNRPWEHLGNLAVNVGHLANLPDDTVADVHTKESRYAELVRSGAYESGRQLADAWCAAFVWKKRKQSSPGAKDGFDFPITNEIFRRLERNPHDCPPWMRDEIRRLADQYQFFHWHLAFPDVFRVSTTGKEENRFCGWDGGFDVLLGNPPWELVELSEKEFFAQRAPEIAAAVSARQRQSMLKNLEAENASLYKAFTDAKRWTSGFRVAIQNTGRFPYSSTGRINLYPIFAECAVSLLAMRGRSGIIVPSAIAMDAYNAPLFGWLLEKQRLISLFDFENSAGIFSEVHRQYRFCLLTLGGESSGANPINFCYFANRVDEVSDPSRRICLTTNSISLFSPNTLAPPILLNATDIRLAQQCYSRIGVFLDRRQGRINEWNPSIQRMLSLSDEGDIFRRFEEISTLSAKERNAWERVYSGKVIHSFNHRFATFDTSGWRTTTDVQKSDAEFAIDTEYYVKREVVYTHLGAKYPSAWLFGFRAITNATNERTSIAAIVPRVGCDKHCRNIFFGLKEPLLISCLVGNFNAFVFDYFARQKIIGTGMGAGILEQLPVLPPTSYQNPCLWSGTPQSPKVLAIRDWLLARVLELTYTALDLEPFARDCGYNGPPFCWDEDRRFLLRCELDAAFFHLYGINREDTAYIMDTFPIVRRKDEEKHGHYRTKDTILEIYDALAAATKSGQPYQTRLDPPPANLRCCHSPRKPQL